MPQRRLRRVRVARARAVEALLDRGPLLTYACVQRRLRALFREILPATGFAGCDHVLIGRAGGIERDFGEMRLELSGAISKLRQ